MRPDELKGSSSAVPSRSPLAVHPSDRHRLAPAFTNPSTNSSGILNGRFIRYPSLRKDDLFVSRVRASGTGAHERTFPDSIYIDGKPLDLVVQCLFGNAQKHRSRLDVALLATQRVLDDRPLDILELPRQ